MVNLHTNFGTITLQLDAEKAPISVANFLKYIEGGFYSKIGRASCRERVYVLV